MTAVRTSAIALAALALLPATASAANVTVTGDDGNPLAINTTAPTADPQRGRPGRRHLRRVRGRVPQDHVFGPDGVAASSGPSCYPKSAITDVSRLRRLPRQRRLRRGPAVVHRTSACTTGAKEQRFLYSINAGTAITPPAGVVLTREPNSFSTITHKVPVALNPGAFSYEVRYARGGVIGPDGAISGPSADAFLDRTTGFADARFTEPGST